MRVVVPFLSFLACVLAFALVGLQAANLLKAQEALRSRIPNFEVVCERPTDQWKAHLFPNAWKKVVSSTGFLFGKGAKSRSCNRVHQRQLLF